MLEKTKISTLKQSDIETIARIHNEQLGDGFSALLGKNFIKKMYKKMLEDGNWGYAYCVNDKIVGFIFSNSGATSIIGCIGLTEIPRAIIKFIKKPSLFIDLFFLVTKKLFKKSHLVEKDLIIDLSAFAVIDEFKSQGIGKKLISAFTDKACQEGYKFISTSTHNEELRDYYLNNKDIKHENHLRLFSFTRYYLIWYVDEP